MDVTLVLSAIICTLLALVVATSLLSGSAGDFANARNYFSHRDSSAGGLDWSGPRHNGYFPDKRKKKTAVDDWSDVSGSSHDHWDVVKTVLSEETHQHPHTEGQATAGDHWSSTSSRSVPRPGSSLDVDSSFEASSGRGHRSFIGLSGQDLLKCAFSYPQNEGATENPGNNDKMESKANNFMKYIPGKSQSHHLQTMMSKEELEEEQRVQQEQLAAIFQLLKDNKETFGDVTEGDMEEQLKLYSI